MSETTIYIENEPRGFVLILNYEQIETLQTMCDFVRDDDDKYAPGEFAENLYHAIAKATEKYVG